MYLLMPIILFGLIFVLTNERVKEINAAKNTTSLEKQNSWLDKHMKGTY